MYGDLGNKLVRLRRRVSSSSASLLFVSADSDAQVQHAKRTQNLAHLPPYQTEIVRAVTREVRDLDKDVALLLEPFHGSFDPNAEQATACALLVDHLAMRRNKRCLLAYHRTRADKLEELVWKGSDVVDLSVQQVRDASLGRGAGGAGGGGSRPHAARDNGLSSEASGASSSLSPQEEDYVRQYSDLLAAYKGQWTDIDLTGSLEPPRDLFIDVRVLKDAGEIQTEYGCAVAPPSSPPSPSHLLPFVLTRWQVYHAEPKQPVLCAARRRRAADRPGIPPEAGMNDARSAGRRAGSHRTPPALSALSALPKHAAAGVCPSCTHWPFICACNCPFSASRVPHDLAGSRDANARASSVVLTKHRTRAADASAGDPADRCHAV